MPRSTLSRKCGGLFHGAGVRNREKIQKVGIIWLKSTKRSHSDKKMQGIGWEVVQPELSIDTNFEFFLKMYDIFKLLNPKPEPIFKNYPLSAKLDF